MEGQFTTIYNVNDTFMWRQTPLMEFSTGLKNYGTPIVIITGLTGNLLCIFVFMTTRYLKSLSSTVYLSALATADFLACLFLFISEAHIAIGWCPATIYLSNVCRALSTWYIVAFSTERYIAVCHPQLRSRFCTRFKARICVCLILLGALAFCSHRLISTTYSDEERRCILSQESSSWPFIEDFVNLLVPSAMIIFTNSKIVRKTMRFYRKFAITYEPATRPVFARNYAPKASSHEELKPTIRKTSKTQVYMIGNAVHYSSGARTYRSVQIEQGRDISKRIPSLAQQLRITKMLIIVSSVFILLNAPVYVVQTWTLIYHKLTVQSPSDDYEVEYDTTGASVALICAFLHQTTYAVNFFLYNICVLRFRQALLASIRNLCKKMVLVRVTCTTKATVRKNNQRLDIADYLMNKCQRSWGDVFQGNRQSGIEPPRQK